MRSVAFVAAILAGYAAISFGLLKILWIKFGAHFYWSDHSHNVQAPLGMDAVLILALIIAGLSMISLRHVIPASLTVVGILIYEYLFLHDEVHSLIQVLFALGLISGQLIAFFLNTMVAIEYDRRFKGRIVE
ncbi:hypothetical protein SAMN05444003_2458 [Cognatiyoonia sediminum]|uniref:Uncharacterized protein n=1 Tax=Cognatiyoonia sediminum TaxID=1508389 RepID=A0A1M5R2W3_9RHOB|nr:hypothetical protein [Cognatiyoonia sediminum]SHH20339.1 hypothetical protein SAMN05444003_2458 [Cognatiyoonia sediminum]